MFEDGLISKWDHALPKTENFVRHEGQPVDLVLTADQEALIEEARKKVAALTGFTGKGRLK